MMARKITCTNEDQISVLFTDRFTPWLLESCEGIYESKNNVSTSVNTMTDGSTLQGSTVAMRNIVLTLRDRPEADHQENRTLLYNLFKPKSGGVFIYEENKTVRKIGYEVESIKVDGEKRSRRATISLLCPDPFFVDEKENVVELAGWSAGFTWPHIFPMAGESFGSKAAERIKTISNTSAADHIGLTFTIQATGQATNPKITLVEQNASIEIGTDGNPMNMLTGDKVIITTHTNNKHVYLERGGVKTEINEYLSEDSEFLQLMHGENTFGYSADSGDEYLDISIAFQYHYLGV